MTDEEKQSAYFNTFLATEQGRLVLSDIRDAIYGEVVENREAAINKLGRIELFEGILKNCGVTDSVMIEALASAVAPVEKETKDNSMYGD